MKKEELLLLGALLFIVGIGVNVYGLYTIFYNWSGWGLVHMWGGMILLGGCVVLWDLYDYQPTKLTKEPPIYYTTYLIAMKRNSKGMWVRVE